MQDIRIRLEQQQLPTTANSNLATSDISDTNIRTTTTSTAATATLATTPLSLQQRRPLQLLPQISLSEISIEQRPFSYQHQKHHKPHQQQQQQHHQQYQQLHQQQKQQQQQHFHLNYTTDEEQQTLPPHSPSSEEDNSPTEMNNCRRLVDKPPLVKRLTMGLLRVTEDSRPLVHGTSSSLLNSSSSHTISDGYVNEAICEPDKLISSKFGDSCRQSLSALEATQQQHSEFGGYQNQKKYLRETCSANSSPKMFVPTAPIRLDSLSLAEQQELKGAAWFQAGLPREISLEVLSRQSPGAFLVRQSSTKPGCFALSLRVPPPAPKVAHYLILRTPRGYKIKGFTKEFSSLRALITHHSVMPELLPVPLSLPRPTYSSVGGSITDSRNGLRGTQFEAEPDFEMYGSLNDFRNAMADLNA